MKLTRVENRCDHGFLEGSGLCPICEGGCAIRDGAKVTTEILVPGLVVGGSTIERRLGDTTIEMRCACGELFTTTRTVLYKVRHKETRSCCAQCRRAKPHGLEGKYTCSGCGEEKPKAAFYASKTESRGHQSRCKTCDHKRSARGRSNSGTKPGERSMTQQVDRPFLDFSESPGLAPQPAVATPAYTVRPKPLPPREELTSPMAFGAYCLNPPNLPPPRPRFVPARQKIAAEPQRVVNAMANQYQVSPQELLGQKRSRGLAEARLATYWLLRTLTDMSSTEIGHVLKKDHSTVLMGIKRCARFRLEDNAYRERIDAMAKEILEAAE